MDWVGRASSLPNRDLPSRALFLGHTQEFKFIIISRAFPRTPTLRLSLRLVFGPYRISTQHFRQPQRSQYPLKPWKICLHRDLLFFDWPSLEIAFSLIQ